MEKLAEDIRRRAVEKLASFWLGTPYNEPPPADADPNLLTTYGAQIRHDAEMAAREEGAVLPVVAGLLSGASMGGPRGAALGAGVGALMAPLSSRLSGYARFRNKGQL